jgi:protein-S-isoprenylcysteine O-methyltransferase Ste14
LILIHESLGLILFWLVYLGSHSLFASFYVKDKARKLLGEYGRYYRIIYVFVYTVALFIPVLIFNPAREWIYSPNIISACAGIMLAGWGTWIIKVSFRHYSLREFSGLYYLDRDREKENLITSGILSRVRHPLYSATLLIISGIFLVMPSVFSLISFTCITVYTFIGIRLEENKLVEQFGQLYLEYKKQVPMLIPRLFLSNSIKKPYKK